MICQGTRNLNHPYATIFPLDWTPLRVTKFHTGAWPP